MHVLAWLSSCVPLRKSCHSLAWLKDRESIDFLACHSLARQMVDLKPVFKLVRAASASTTLKDRICCGEIRVQKGDSDTWLLSLLKENFARCLLHKMTAGWPPLIYPAGIPEHPHNIRKSGPCTVFITDYHMFKVVAALWAWKTHSVSHTVCWKEHRFWIPVAQD